jgi:hypothetical protein
MNQNLLRPGTGFFTFSDRAVPAAGSIRVFYACPDSDVRDAPIVIAMHGLSREAEAFRDVLVDRAARNGQIVLVPEFAVHQFPDVYAYNFGGVRLPPPSDKINLREEWNFGIIDRLFQHVRREIGSSKTTFRMFGNSAGSQYVLRYLSLTGGAAVDRAVASNSGVYMLPDLQTEYPFGMGGLDLNENHLRRYFGFPLVLLLGDADTDTSAPDLPRNDAAMAQGPHRLARGHWYFGLCKELASNLGLDLAWKLEVVPGAGHVSQGIFDRAADILNS